MGPRALACVASALAGSRGDHRLRHKVRCFLHGCGGKIVAARQLLCRGLLAFGAGQSPLAFGRGLAKLPGLYRQLFSVGRRVVGDLSVLLRGIVGERRRLQALSEELIEAIEEFAELGLESRVLAFQRRDF